MGTNVSREGDKLTTGHDCVATTELATPGQDDVFAQSELVARLGDPTVSHPFPPKPPCLPHTAYVTSGSPSVYCHGKKVARVTSSADAGNMIEGAPKVYCE